MKKDLLPEMNKKYNTVALYVIVVALIIVAVVFAFVFISPISSFCARVVDLLSPVLYGFTFAYVMCPLCNLLDSWFLKLIGTKKIHKFTNPIVKRLGIIFTYIIVIAAIIGFVAVIIPEVSASFKDFTENYDLYYKSTEKFIKNTFDSIASTSRFIPVELAGRIETALTEILHTTLDKSVTIIADLSPILLKNISNFAFEIFNIALGFVISIYMLAERKRFARQGRKLIYGLLPDKAACALDAGFKQTHKIFGGFITGKIVDSLIIGVLCYIGMVLLKIPNAALVSLIVGVTNIIPYFGPFFGAIPSAIIIFFNDPLKALVFVVFILVLQQVDGNIIGPAILKESVGVSALWIVASLLVMGGLFGVTGMIIAVPLFALTSSAIAALCNARLKSKGYTVTEKGVYKEIVDDRSLYGDEFEDVEYSLQNSEDSQQQ